MLPGKLDKMKLQAYSDENFTQKQGAAFSVLINPDSYTIRYRVEHTESQGQGTSHPPLHFNKILAQDIHFDFVFDSSGVVVEPSLLMGGLINPFAQTANIIEQIETFKRLMLSYQSETHRPNFVALHWGTLLFKGQLTSLDIEYKLFKPDGTPIRAVAKTDFRGYIEDNLRVALENPLSPDITHERTVKSDDRFDLMVSKIYDHPKYYIEAAKANGLTGFRKIPTGTKLFFPPVEK
jgi:hypothetical protein